MVGSDEPVAFIFAQSTAKDGEKTLLDAHTLYDRRG